MLLRFDGIIVFFGSNNVALNNASNRICWIERNNVVKPSITWKMKYRLFLLRIDISCQYRLLGSQAHEK